MKLTSISIRRFRTIDSLDLSFPSSYSALCGPNDSGKTNVIRALRALLKETAAPYFPGEDEEVTVKDDFPKWLDTPSDQRQVEISCRLSVDEKRDTGLYQFLVRQLQLKETSPVLDLGMKATYSPESASPKVEVELGQRFDGIEAQEVFKRLQSSQSILFHNSPQSELMRLRFREGFGLLRELSGEAAASLDTLKKDVEKKLQRIAKGQQQDLESLLGRLETKYKVGLSVASFDLGWLPFNLTLGDSKHNVRLDDWGSGTQNRTLILRTLFRAKQIGESEASAEKITPLIVIEEPESFLHPYAQAEFGRVLQDLAEEFQVQVLVTTHSPYLLSLNRPDSNILLGRRTHHGQLRETQRVDTEGDAWMTPFGQALGMHSEEFKPWHKLFRTDSDAVLLVEGETDKEYLELLRNPEHGSSALSFSGEIVSYDGAGTLRNTVLLRFIKNKYRRVFVTFDLDVKGEVERCLTALGMKREVDYLPLGIDAAGKRAIEGLVPEPVRAKVYAANADLIAAATAGTKEERDSARSALKRNLLAEFRRSAKPGTDDFAEFYKVARVANKALRMS